MKRVGIILSGGVLLMGCQGGATATGDGRHVDRAWSRQDREAAKASVAMPEDGHSKGKLNVCTLVQGDSIKFINFTDQPIVDATIWIEGKFMTKLSALPAQGSITLNKENFVNSAGQSLATAQGARITSVTIEQPDGMYGTLAPVNER